MQQQGSISVVQGAGIMLSTLLGSGVLLVPALVATTAGSYALLAWLLMAIAVLPIVFTFAALGRHYPNHGGTAHFVRLAFGTPAANAIGWLYVSIAPIGPPVVFITGAAYLAQLLSLPPSWALCLELLMLLAIVLLNRARLTTSVRLQTALSFLVTGIIIAVCAWALWRSDAPLPSSSWQPLAVGQAMAMIFWCFVGIEAICHVANEFRQPQRDFPRAVVLGVFCAGAIYVLLSIAVLRYGVFGDEQTNLLSVTLLAQQAVGAWGAKLIALVGFVACFCAVNLYVVSFARMLSSLADEGAVAARFAAKNRYGSPTWAMWLVVVAIALVLLLRQLFGWSFEVLLAYANAVFVLIYLAAGLAAWRLLQQGRRWIAALAVVFCALIALLAGASLLYGVVIFVLAMLFYQRKHKQLTTLTESD